MRSDFSLNNNNIHLITRPIIADDLYLCLELVITATTLTYSRVIWINRVRLPNLLVGSCILRGKYIGSIYVLVQYCCLYWFIYQVPVYFYLETCTFVHGSLLYNNIYYVICLTTTLQRYVYVELCLYV